MYAVIEMKLNRTTPNLNPAFDLDKLIGLYKENQLNRRWRWQNWLLLLENMVLRMLPDQSSLQKDDCSKAALWLS